jgi:hypothetical protein
LPTTHYAAKVRSALLVRGIERALKEKESFGILKERVRLWPRTISAEWQASTYWDYFAVWEEIELSF